MLRVQYNIISIYLNNLIYLHILSIELYFVHVFIFSVPYLTCLGFCSDYHTVFIWFFTLFFSLVLGLTKVSSLLVGTRPGRWPSRLGLMPCTRTLRGIVLYYIYLYTIIYRTIYLFSYISLSGMLSYVTRTV